jgi:hypothetical protein
MPGTERKLSPRLRQAVLLLLLVLPGIAVAAVCGYYLLRDWAALIAAFGRLERATRGGDLREIVVAQGFDSIYRLNCFADGVGLLLGALLFGLGVHGLCTLPSARER